MAMKAPYIILNSKAFDYNAKDRHMYAEASTCRFARYQQIWDDAEDCGIYIQSHKTSSVQCFLLDKIVTDNEGGIQAWEFSSLDPKLNLSVTIFND